MDLPGGRLVGLEARPHDDQLRTQRQCRTRGHRRVHAEGTRLIVAGSHHPAPVRRTAHGHGAPGQPRVVAHLDGGKEAVAVDVDDFSLLYKHLIFQGFASKNGFDTRFNTRFFIRCASPAPSGLKLLSHPSYSQVLATWRYPINSLRQKAKSPLPGHMLKQQAKMESTKGIHLSE
ncbi:hypothetical protein D3C78_485440 [compost metagenome]